MAIALVQTGTELDVTAGVSGTITLTSVTAGNLLAGVADDVDGNTVTFAFTDDKSNSWSQAVHNDNSGYSASIHGCLNAASGTTVITVTASGTTDFVAQAQEWSGGTWTLDGTPSSIDESATTNHVCSASGSVIDTTGADLVLCNSTTNNGSSFGTRTAGSGYTAFNGPGPSDFDRAHWQYQVFTTAQANEQGAFTSANSKATAACIAAFLCTAAATPCPSDCDWWPCCGGGSSAAYHLGGSTIATANRTCFSNDVTYAVPSANLTLARAASSGLANPSVAGYIAGGFSNPFGVTALTDKLMFSGETTAAMTTANLSTTRENAAAVSERSTKGYFLGGTTDAVPPGVVTGDKLTFSSDVTAAVGSSDLSIARRIARGISEGTSKGYIGGGVTVAAASVSIVNSDKITFSSDTTSAQTSANLTLARGGYHSMSDGSTKGYWAGGASNVNTVMCDKITFSTDVTSSQTSAAIDRSEGTGSSNGTKGYVGGGNVTGTGVTNLVTKFAFSTDTNSATGVNMTISTFRNAGLSTVGL